MSDSEKTLPSALESVSIDEIRDATKPSDFTVYTQELIEGMDKNDVKDDYKREITLATLWRLADAGNYDELTGDAAQSFLEKFYSFSGNEKNHEITDKVIESLMTVVFRKAENNNWGLNGMTEKMENFILEYLKGRLVGLRKPGEEVKHERISKIITDVVSKQEAQSDVNEGSENIDDMLMGDFGGQYELSERFVLGLSELLEEDDKKAAEDSFKKDIKGAEDFLK